MRKLLNEIELLKKTQTRKIIDDRIKEFSEFQQCKNNKVLFNEMCFCILTANYNADKAIKIQYSIGNGFNSLAEKQLSKKLKELGHRYPNTRANYIVSARNHRKNLHYNIHSFKNQQELREWIVKNVKGLGYKEASHFLRNIGFEDLAIIDFHIVDILVDNRVIERPKTLTAKKYIEIENVLRKIGEKSGLSLAELDLYLWFLETGKVLK